jgi:hypothetical protein
MHSSEYSQRKSFLASYQGSAGSNRFTKVKMDLQADGLLRQYFATKKARMHEWFNVITPSAGSLEMLCQELHQLAKKDWKNIHQL